MISGSLIFARIFASVLKLSYFQISNPKVTAASLPPQLQLKPLILYGDDFRLGRVKACARIIAVFV